MAENLLHLITTGEYTIYKNITRAELLREKQYSIFYNHYNIHRDSHTKLEHLYQFTLSGVGILLFTIFGVVGNILTIIVLRRNKFNSSISNLLKCLAVSDTVLVLSTLFLISVPTICNYLGIDFTQFYSFMTVPIVFPLALTSYTISSYIIVLITVQRYLAVAHPIKARVYYTNRRTKYLCLWIIIFSIAYNAPRWGEYSYNGVRFVGDQMGIGGGNGTDLMYMPLTTTFRRSYYFDRVYIQLLFLLLMYITPMSFLVVLNFLIYRGVKEATTNRVEMGSQVPSTPAEESQHQQLGRMLSLLVTIYLVCNSIAVLEGMLVLKTGQGSSIFIESTRNFLINFNSSINFLIYFGYSSEFRRVALALFGSCCRGELSPGASMKSTNTVRMSL